jgi:hypothetical protein
MDLTAYYCLECDVRHDLGPDAAPFVCGTYYSNDKNNYIDRTMRAPAAQMAHCQIAVINQNTGEEQPLGRNNGGGRADVTPPRSNAEASSSSEVTVSKHEWDIAQYAIIHNTDIPQGASPGTLHAYHRMLEENRIRLAKEQALLDRRKEAADLSSQRRAALSHIGSANSRSVPPRGKHHPRIPRLSERDAAEMTRDLSNSYMTTDSAGIIRPKTKEGAAAHLAAYLINNPPPPNDPRAQLHRMALESIGILGNDFMPTGGVATAARRSPARVDKSPRHGDGARRRRSRSPDRSPPRGSGSRRHSSRSPVAAH